MISQSTLRAYRDTFTTTTRSDETTVTILRDNLPDDIRAHLLDILHDAKEKSGNIDLAYDIVRDACDLLPDTIEALATFDPYDITVECASVYAYQRLEYLNPNNQYDITEVLKETNATDIATACAIFYDRIVQETIADMVDFFTHNS